MGDATEANVTTNEAPSGAGAGTEGAAAATPPPAPESSDPAPAPDAPAGDAKPEATKEIPTAQETALMRNLRRREAQLVERQQRHAQERAAIETAKAEAARVRESAEALVKLAKEDPLAFVTKHGGIREEDLARRWINGGQPHEKELEHQRNSVIDELRAEIKALKDEKAAEKQTAEQAAKAARDAEQAKNTVAKFTAYAKANAAKVPHAARAIEALGEEAVDECDRIATKLLREGKRFASEEALWQDVLTRYDARFVKLTGGATPAPSQEGPKGSEKLGQQGQEADAGKTGKTVPTLTGKGASPRSAATNPDFLAEDVSLDPSAARKRALERVEQALAQQQQTKH